MKLRKINSTVAEEFIRLYLGSDSVGDELSPNKLSRCDRIG
ncbi:hypothetical protein [Microcoleus sp. FACHB-SPT15]|nr:hypothetical protein [Microcoleus sp. FACHB-SPT15]